MMQSVTLKDQTQSMMKPIRAMHALRIGETAMIYDIPDIRLLPSLGVRIGKTVKVITKSFANGPLVVLVDQAHSVVIDQEIAKLIMIKG